MSLKWPNDRTKFRSLRGSTPAVILGQLIEVADQIKTITVTVVDGTGDAETFSSAMPLSDLAFHAIVHDEDVRAVMRGEQGVEVPEETA